MIVSITVDTEKDGQESLERMIRADSAWYALGDIRNQCRTIWKYRDLDGVKPADLVDEIYEMICNSCSEAGLDDVWT